MNWTYYGGPADGRIVEKYLWDRDFIVMEIANGNNNGVSYVYMKCPDGHDWFEYAGETREVDSV